MNVFRAADILVPKTDEPEKWAVIACDQYTSQKEYWQAVKEYVGDSPSSLHLILPEAFLDHTDPAELDAINETMRRYLDTGIFALYPDSYIYTERTLQNGKIRRGIVGMLDLEQYDYAEGSTSLIRATEYTVPERIPPRMKIRENAALELPHILMLSDDTDDVMLGCCEEMKDELPVLYSFELMMNGGRITGRLVLGKHRERLDEAVSRYETDVRKRYSQLCGQEIAYAAGDGNHSLASARAHYERLRKAGADNTHPARYALAELGNLHDESLVFEPIHRLVKTDVSALLAELESKNTGDFPLRWITARESGTIWLDLHGHELPLALLQKQLDDWAAANACEIDYIHGEDTLQKLVQEPGTVGFLLPAIAKDRLFADILNSGVLPRKTFSMGHADEKRYYIESRKIV